ncbi:all-trans retinoic acid-induced differentiation factor isoform X1 [Spea bombifrons]|uniref:all-trans retinoic acid-induced differentiation factor isoform X1 n=1 Tax=Spea bombifrons TaxID=233779 RepID=UPI002349BC6E|nr:all-trans retinoic acid-induced differentiation factor isoform X1 [Spea bombifrons]
MMAAVSVTLCLSVFLGAAWVQGQICSSCPGDLRNSSEVLRLCGERGARIRGRCCVSQAGDSEVIIGLDLWNCSLGHLDPALNLSDSIVVMDISQNPLLDLSQELFRGLADLRYIALPLNLSCPGGNDVWETVTAGVDSRVCQDQKSACNGSGAFALLCPESSLCAPDGPGYTRCVCAPGFHGYKCLREGEFPLLMFCGILGAVSLSLAGLLWVTQRRKVKSQ